MMQYYNGYSKNPGGVPARAGGRRRPGAAAWLRRCAGAACAAWLGIVGPAGAGAQEPPAPNVVVSVAPLHSLVAAVMDGVATPHLLLRSAASPHQMVLRPSDARALAGAGVVFWAGPELESALEKSIPAVAEGARAVMLTRVPEIFVLPVRAGGAWEAAADEDEAHGAPGRGSVNPHIWLDPLNAKRIAAVAARVLAEVDPARAARYRDNAARLAARLDALDRDLEGRLAGVRAVPFLVFHDAYAYVEARYGLRAVGAISLHPGVAPGARRLSDLRRRIAEQGVACVFAEPQFVPAVVEALVEGTPARVGVLDPLGFGLAPGPQAYFALMDKLADDLVACLAPG